MSRNAKVNSGDSHQEALRHAVYLFGRMMESDQGEELLRIPVFGSVAWVHIDKDE
jgi:hypothetical protein